MRRDEKIKDDVVSTWHQLASGVGSDGICGSEAAVALERDFYSERSGYIIPGIEADLVAPGRE